MSFIIKFERIINKSIDEIKYKIPNIQRKINHDIVDKIYNFQKEYFLTHDSIYCLNGSISIGYDLNNGIEYLLDGQHRVCAYKKLRDEFPERSLTISIDYYYFKGEEAMNLIYKYINTCTPNDITILGIDEYKILQSFERLMTNQFKCYIKTSKNPIRPNINLQNIKDYIIENEILKKCNIISGEDLYNSVLKINKFYSGLQLNKFNEWGVKEYQKILEKISSFENKLYIGLYTNYEWIDRIVDSVVNKIPFEEMEHITKNWRPKLTKNLKVAVWKYSNGNTLTDGSCYCCKDLINYENFEVGHIIPVAIGGKTNLENCRAICGACNLDMKTMNLEEYKKLLESQIKDI